MKKILAFAASSSKNSINKQLVQYAATLLQNGICDNAQIEIIDLNDFEMPLYSIDLESASGIPNQAHAFFNKITDADALLVSYAEHNGNYTAAYKNIFDWASRINPKVYQGKPMVVLSASPGPGAASNVMGLVKNSAPHFAADIKADMSVGKFGDNFDTEAGVLTNPELKEKLIAALQALK